MKKVILTRGLPASGKTTWAKNTVRKSSGGFKRVNKDDLRAMLDCGKWSKHNEKFILNLRNHIILQALKDGKHVIVDDTNLHPKHEAAIRELVKGIAVVEIKEFDTDVDTCIKRDLERPNSVGHRVIRGMYKRYIKKCEQVEQDGSLPEAVIFDIDGTLALMGDRSPFDWGRVGEDRINSSIVEILDVLKASGKKIVITTGRDGSCIQKTLDWLNKWDIEYDDFYMRPPGNTEKDSVIKRKMLDEIVKKYCVMAVFDDRNQVVEMWRNAGLTCLQVAEGDF